MKIDQQDLDDFGLAVRKLYDHLKAKENRDWIEEPNAEPVSLSAATVAWCLMRKVRFFSPAVGEFSVLDIETQDILRVLQTYKHLELEADFTAQGSRAVFRAMASDILLVFGCNDHSLLMIEILHAVHIGPLVYTEINHHWPVNEKKFVLAFAKNQYDAVRRDY